MGSDNSPIFYSSHLRKEKRCLTILFILNLKNRFRKLLSRGNSFRTIFFRQFGSGPIHPQRTSSRHGMVRWGLNSCWQRGVRRPGLDSGSSLVDVSCREKSRKKGCCADADVNWVFFPQRGRVGCSCGSLSTIPNVPMVVNHTSLWVLVGRCGWTLMWRSISIPLRPNSGGSRQKKHPARTFRPMWRKPFSNFIVIQRAITSWNEYTPK